MLLTPYLPSSQTLAYMRVNKTTGEVSFPSTFSYSKTLVVYRIALCCSGSLFMPNKLEIMLKDQFIKVVFFFKPLKHALLKKICHLQKKVTHKCAVISTITSDIFHTDFCAIYFVYNVHLIFSFQHVYLITRAQWNPTERSPHRTTMACTQETQNAIIYSTARRRKGCKSPLSILTWTA